MAKTQARDIFREIEMKDCNICDGTGVLGNVNQICGRAICNKCLGAGLVPVDETIKLRDAEIIMQLAMRRQKAVAIYKRQAMQLKELHTLAIEKGFMPDGTTKAMLDFYRDWDEDLKQKGIKRRSTND